MLKRVLPLLLLLGTWIGLLGQEVAFARSPDLARPAAVAQQTARANGMDCAGMSMVSRSHLGGSKPCKGSTPDCIAKMGCVAPVLLNEGTAPAAITPPVSGPPFQPSTSHLAGRSYAPEPYPPNILN